MKKELNSGLFGDGNATAEKIFEKRNGENSQLLMEQRIAELRVQMNSLSDHLAKVVSQINEFIKSSHHKFERVQTALQHLEQNDQNLNHESTQKFNSVQNKLTERRTLDTKVQELIDRHNGSLKTYEVRLNQMQKLLAEREAQVMSAQSTLNEAKMEITRLKRF